MDYCVMEAVAAKVAKEDQDEMEEQKREDWKKQHNEMKERLQRESAA